MAKVRTMANAMRTGRVGDTTYYVRNGEQIARQSRNNSNYGESASRTESQQRNRVLWANLVNVYKACRQWMPKAFESKASNQTDYNRFMSLNRPSATIALTKDQANNGCAVMEGYAVSQGSLQPIQVTVGSTEGSGVANVITNIVVSMEISGSVTVGQLSADILANNQLWDDGDNLAVIVFDTVLDARGYPYLSSLYREITLDTSSVIPLSVLGFESGLVSVDGRLGLSASYMVNGGYDGVVFIHTRKEGGSLKVSTQDIIVYDNTIIQEFSSPAQVLLAIASYGVNSDVPLDPGEGGFEYYSETIIGSGENVVNGKQFTLEPGQYKVYVSPSHFSVAEIEDNATDCFWLVNSSGDASQGSVNRLSRKKVQIVSDGAPNGDILTITAERPLIQAMLRADAGTEINLSIVKVS